MQVRTNPSSYKDPSVYVCESIANLRQQEAPTAFGSGAVTKQSYTLAVLIGSVSAFDGTYAIYVWNASSTAADDGGAVIKPNSPQVGSQPGRWIRTNISGGGSGSVFSGHLAGAAPSTIPTTGSAIFYDLDSPFPVWYWDGVNWF